MDENEDSDATIEKHEDVDHVLGHGAIDEEPDRPGCSKKKI